MQTRVDPFLAAVIHGALENIAIEMGHKLMRMSYSSIIRESEDFGAALIDVSAVDTPASVLISGTWRKSCSVLR